MKTLRLYRIILPVTSIGRAVKFYASVLGEKGRRVSPGRHYFECGGVILAVYDPGADGDRPRRGWRFHPFQYLYFSVPDLDKVLRRVRRAGGRVDSPIADMPWGERVFYARDPLGSRLCFVETGTVFTGSRRNDRSR
jgi:predicted enzyme related to lactoylglutathione lyase